jgi:hypothetical protein
MISAACARTGETPGSDSSAPSTPPVAASTSPVRSSEIAATHLPFGRCTDAGVEISALDPTTGAVLKLYGPFSSTSTGWCPNPHTDPLPDPAVTQDGRFVVGAGTILDVASGQPVSIDVDGLSAEIPQDTGLDAESVSLDGVSGYNLAGSGTAFLYRGFPIVGQNRHSNPDTVFYSVDLKPTTATHAAPQAIAGRSFCYATRYWSQDSSACFVPESGASSGDGSIVAVDAQAVDDVYPHDVEIGRCPNGEQHGWLDARFLFATTNAGREIVRCDTDGNVSTAIELQGDRRLSLWVNARSNRVYFVSPTISRQRYEVFELKDPTGQDPQASLVTSLPDFFVPIMN